MRAPKIKLCTQMVIMMVVVVVVATYVVTHCMYITCQALCSTPDMDLAHLIHTTNWQVDIVNMPISQMGNCSCSISMTVGTTVVVCDEYQANLSFLPFPGYFSSLHPSQLQVFRDYSIFICVQHTCWQIVTRTFKESGTESPRQPSICQPQERSVDHSSPYQTEYCPFQLPKCAEGKNHHVSVFPHCLRSMANKVQLSRAKREKKGENHIIVLS